ncbi:YbaB/EbfC family nucleoid-associated protein [Gordonia sp. ABSL1-1]|uniref:YbaB/EbfC family nucleoid-associated protein n=1 Tax=Gordonia sp. ABSL1-1 TaxID=3053923 RepID=UPI00257319B1|nr:YbaB/EbfC family nucleoid-associated protein [Gordonia sp. ABSL1-1]MDL9937739.1 YbaB/EbfC family nucleoid-associated protein [Gordonia sp. ABSL1-1]
MTAGGHELGFDFHELVANAQEQVGRLMDAQRQRAALVASASVADRMVTVHVNAQGVVIKTEIDEDFLDDHDLDDLAGFITEAAQQAAADVARRGAELMKPVEEVAAGIPSLSEVVDGAPDLRDFIVSGEQISTAPPDAPERSIAPHPGAGGWA